MTETTKIRLINAYANLLDVFARNSKELKENMRCKNNIYTINFPDYENICETIAHLSKEIQSIRFNDEIKVEVR